MMMMMMIENNHHDHHHSDYDLIAWHRTMRKSTNQKYVTDTSATIILPIHSDKVENKTKNKITSTRLPNRV